MLSRLVFILFTALAILAAMFLMANALHADVIIGPVASGYPQFNAPCSGYESTGSCEFGEVRFYSPLGEILTAYLAPTRFTSTPDPDPIPDWSYTPDPAPVPQPMAVPEPNYLYVLLLIGAIVGLWRAGRAIGNPNGGDEDGV